MQPTFEALANVIRTDACRRYLSTVAAMRDGMSIDSGPRGVDPFPFTKAATAQLDKSGAVLLDALHDVHLAEGSRDLAHRADELRSMFARELLALAERIAACRDEQVAAFLKDSGQTAHLPNLHSSIQKLEELAEKKIVEMISSARHARRLNRETRSSN